MSLEDLSYRVLPRLNAGSSLARIELLTLTRVAEVLLLGVPHAIRPEQVVANVDAFLVAGRSRRAWRVRVLLQLIEWSTLTRYGRRFSQLTLAERNAVVRNDWIGGRGVHRICAKVRNLVVLGAYGDRSAAAATGYVPVPQRQRFKALRLRTPQSSA